MIHDIIELSSDSDLFFDICIIGSGAAGIAIAREFINTSQNVVILEGGGKDFEQISQDPYQSEVIGLAHGGIHQARARVVGGTTTLWAGQALPLWNMDFQYREWVDYSGWPIAKEQLADYYKRAEVVMQIPQVTYDLATWPVANHPKYDSNTFTSYFSQFTSTPNFSQKYYSELKNAPNITLLTHANVLLLEPTADATSISKVLVRSMSGTNIQVKAKFFIICCGGIESARLLLLSDSVETAGIGNRYDNVGRFFQDHPGVGIPISPINRNLFNPWCNGLRRKNIKHALKVVPSEIFQEKHQILQVGAEVYYPTEQDDTVVAAKEILRSLRSFTDWKSLPQKTFTIFKNPARLISAIYSYYVLKQPVSIGSTQPYIGIGVEQEPNPKSRITLSREVDCLGKRRSVLDWQLTGKEDKSIEVFVHALAKEWKFLNVADIDLNNFQIMGRSKGEYGGYVDSAHHIGTTRMGNDPKTSVVDADCRVHGYNNLYIGSSSVFSTGGFSNPTLTIIALCLRIADKLKLALAAPNF